MRKAMKKLMSLFACAVVLMSINLPRAEASMLVAEYAAEYLVKASRSEELFRNFGMIDIRGLRFDERVRLFHDTMSYGDPSLQVFARQLRVFEDSYKLSGNVEAAFENAFVRDGQILNMLNVSKFSRMSAEETSIRLRGILEQIERAR
jgi:hypothetical protein